MVSWQHNIERFRNFENYILVCGETFVHKSYKSINWSFLIDENGKLVKAIEPDDQFYHITSLCMCINEILKKYKLKLLFNDDIDDIIVYQSNENGEFSREI